VAARAEPIDAAKSDAPPMALRAVLRVASMSVSSCYPATGIRPVRGNFHI
jgi:hypothetical protein